MEKTLEYTKKIFTEGRELDYHYLNGTFVSTVKVERVSAASVWINGSRQSWNTIRDYFSMDIYREREELTEVSKETWALMDVVERIEADAKYNKLYPKADLDIVINYHLLGEDEKIAKIVRKYYQI